MLEHCDTKDHVFEAQEVGILECELCHKWVPSRAGTVQELQGKIDALGECHMVKKVPPKEPPLSDILNKMLDGHPEVTHDLTHGLILSTENKKDE